MQRYLISAVICMIGYVFTYISCPLWAFIAAVFKLTKLPGIFSLIHTFDDDIYGSKYRKSGMPATFVERFKTACWWIWRNPNYGFNAKVLGLPVEGTLVEVKGSFEFFDTGKTCVITTKFTNPIFEEDFFGYRRDQHLMGRRFIKMWFGWQHNSFDNKHYMLKLMFNPFRIANNG